MEEQEEEEEESTHDWKNLNTYSHLLRCEMPSTKVNGGSLECFKWVGHHSWDTGISAESCGRMSESANLSGPLIFAGISANQTCLKWQMGARKLLRSWQWHVFNKFEAFQADCNVLSVIWKCQCDRPLGPVSHAQHDPALSHGADTPAKSTSAILCQTVGLKRGSQIPRNSPEYTGITGITKIHKKPLEWD